MFSKDKRMRSYFRKLVDTICVNSKLQRRFERELDLYIVVIDKFRSCICGSGSLLIIFILSHLDEEY